MRSLKKILALVLSLAMVLSVTAFAGFTDADKVDVDYAEAVTVLNGMGVFKGYEDGSFKPQGEITRAEVAAIVYRIATADVEDEYVDLWTGTAKFADVADTAWYAGYVGFCASNGYVQGYPDGSFKPEAKVTGFEVLAMILRVNGYDAEKEFSGIKWSDNIAKVAVQNDVLGDVKPGALAKAAPREMVAQLLFGALKAPTVNYTLLNGYVENKGSLGLEKFGLVEKKGEEADDWGRPAKIWEYDTGNEETVFAEEALATYTVATENCDIMADTGLDEDEKLDIYLNGEKQKDKYVIADDDDTFGEQGQLVEVYEECVVVIDTYLGKVTKVVAEETDKRGHVTDAYVKVDVYMGEDKATNMTFDTDEFAKGDMVLVTICDDEIASLEIAESEVSKLTKVSGKNKTVDIQKITQLDKEDVDVAYKADLEPEDGLVVGENYEFYYDNYGNVIGAVELSTYYAVMDSIYSTHIDGEDAAIADLVYFDATMEEDVAVDSAELWMYDDEEEEFFWAEWDAGDFSERKKENRYFYNRVYVYTVEDETYTLVDAEFDYAEDAWFEEGDVYFDADVAGDNRLQISKSTEILLKVKAAPGGTYKAYTGYKDLPNYELTNVWYADFDEDGYVDMLFAEAEEWSSRTVFVYDIEPDAVEYVDDEEYCTAEVEALELIDGELKKVTIDVLFWGEEMDEDQFVNVVGLYEIFEDESEEFWVASYRYELYEVTSLTDDGKRADIVEFGTDWETFAKFDDAKIVKYIGDAQNGKTTTKNVSFEDLTTESLIYVQYEDGEEVVVYDMWVELDVEFDHECDDDCTAENCIYVGAKIVSDPVYFGKALTDEIEVTVPAYVDLEAVESGRLEFVWEDTDAHAEESVLKVETEIEKARIFDDITVYLCEDAKHPCTKLIAVEEPGYTTNVRVAVDQRAKTVVVSGTNWTVKPTILAKDLLKLVEAECEYAQGVEIYDNTLATEVGANEAVDTNMFIVVTAENGETAQYKLILMY